jgi:hypothetical protein
MALSIIRADLRDDRFERFCNDIVGVLEGGIHVLLTSRSWDKGRDGRAETSTITVYVMTSLSDDVDGKSERDARRLKESARPAEAVYFCSSQSLSEKRCDEIAGQLREILGTENKVVVLGAGQLADVVGQSPAVFIEHYGQEFDGLMAMLRKSIDEPVRDDGSLRLALMSIAGETSEEVRDSLYGNVIRTALKTRPSNTAECAKHVSDQFRLHRVLPVEAIERHLEILLAEGDVSLNLERRYELTVAGKEKLAAQELAAVDALRQGRDVIQRHLERSLGHSLTNDHFNRIWDIVREKLASAFFDRGLQLVTQVGFMVKRAAGSEAIGDDRPLCFLPALADAVANTSSSASQQDELRLAIRDMFEEPESETFNWLARLCASYVGLCTLGLEAQSGQALAAVLSKVDLVLDTDIVLSLLCEGEPNHAAMNELVKKWRALGGEVMVSEEVLHEVAHHAVIADREYRHVSHWLPGERREDRLRWIDNAFVRAFAELLAQRRIPREHWRKYIDQYAPAGKADLGRIAELLVQDYGIRELPPPTKMEEDVAKSARKLLVQRAEKSFNGERLRIAIDKAERDASLYAAIVHRHRMARKNDPDRSCILVSSARRLAEVEQRLHIMGEPQLVLSSGSVFYMLSLVPGVSIGVTAMQTLLFEVHKQFSGDVDRTLMRAVHESCEVSLPWARRQTVVRDIKKRVFESARRSAAAAGTRLQDTEGERARVMSDALTEANAPELATIIRDALDQVVVDRRLERENQELRATVETLRAELVRRKKKEPGRSKEAS